MKQRILPGLAGLIVLFGTGAVITQTPDPQVEAIRREYPSYDQPLLYQVVRGLNAREAERSWRAAPGAASTFRRLVEANRIEDALQSLEAGTKGSFDGLIEMLEALGEK